MTALRKGDIVYWQHPATGHVFKANVVGLPRSGQSITIAILTPWRGWGPGDRVNVSHAELVPATTTPLTYPGATVQTPDDRAAGLPSVSWTISGEFLFEDTQHRESFERELASAFSDYTGDKVQVLWHVPEEDLEEKA